MVDENELKKINEKKMDKKVLIGIVIAVVLLIAILIIIFVPKKNNVDEIVLLEDIKTIYVSEKKEIKVEVSNHHDANLKYQSSDENVVKFDNNIMEGVSVGRSTITITSNIDGVEPLVLEISVIDGGGIIKEVNFPKGELVIGVNKEFDLNNELIINPSNGKFNSRIFISSDSSVATINEFGQLKTKKTGMTNITVNINNYFNSTISVFVVNNDVDGEIITNTDKIVFKEDIIKINVGASKKIEYDIYPVDSSMKYVTTSCSDSNIVSLDNNGNIKGLKIGKATIIYKTIDNKEYKLNIEVTDEIIEVEDIKVLQEVSMNIGETKEVLVNVVPSTSTNKGLNVKVSDTKILDASMEDDNLIIKAKNIGNTVITLTSHSGVEKEIKVTVNEKEVSTPIVTVSPTPSNVIDEITDKDYEDRGYTITTTTGNLNKTFDISINDGVFSDSSIINFTAKNDNLNIWVCDYLDGEDKCDPSKGINLKDKKNQYEIKGYGMHIILVYEEGKVLIPYYVYLLNRGYTATNLYLTREDAEKNSYKKEVAISFNINDDKINKLKVCWVSFDKDCNPLTEINTVKPITKINNKLYLNNPDLWKIKVVSLDNNDKPLRDVDTYYVNVIK